MSLTGHRDRLELPEGYFSEQIEYIEATTSQVLLRRTDTGVFIEQGQFNALPADALADLIKRSQENLRDGDQLHALYQFDPGCSHPAHLRFEIIRANGARVINFWPKNI